jgi:hypothetical protein
MDNQKNVKLVICLYLSPKAYFTNFSSGEIIMYLYYVRVLIDSDKRPPICYCKLGLK